MKILIQKLLHESLEKSKDEDFSYKGYDCKISYVEHRNMYGCSVYKNGEYLMGVKGWLPLGKAKKHAIDFIERREERLYGEIK